MSAFPENDVQILFDYLADIPVAQVVQALQKAIPEVAGEIQELPHGNVVAIIGARNRLVFFLSGQDAAGMVTALQKIADAFQHREFGVALQQIDALPANTNLPVLDGQTFSLALTRADKNFTEVQWRAGHGGGGGGGEVPLLPPTGGGGGTGWHKVFIDRTLPGYDGPALSADQIARLRAFRDLVAGGDERRFRQSVLRAEARASQHNFAAAIAEYNAVLASPGALPADRLKFLAVRCGFAHLNQGDTLYRRNRQLNDASRVQVTGEYTAAVQVLSAQGVAPDNPLAKQIADYASLQQARVNAGFNFLGFKDTYVPVLTAPFLLQHARERIAAAKETVSQFINFKSQANQLDRDAADLLLQQQVDTLNRMIADEKSAIADKQKDVADQRVSTIQSELDSLGSNSLLSGTLSLVGAIAGVALGQPGAIGQAVNGVTSAIVGYSARENDLDNQLQVAQSEQQIAGLEQRSAQLEGQIVDARLGFVRDRLATLGAQTLNADLFYALANLFEALAERHTELAIRWAFLYERAVAFRRLKPDLAPIKLDYRQDIDGQGVLIPAPSLLEADLQDVTDADVPDTQIQVLRDNPISLATEYPLEFETFRQTGKMSFVIALYDLEKKRPGTFERRIQDVSIQVIGLVPATGFGGRLIHHGFFLLRDRDTALTATRFVPTKERFQTLFTDLQAGLAQGEPVDGVIPYLLDVNRRELSAAPDGNLLGSIEPGARGLFEGYGEAGRWSLEIDNLDPKRITDVLIAFTLVFPQSDAALQAHIGDLIGQYEAELSGGDALDQITPFSLRNQFPDAFAGLASAGQGSFTLTDDNFPSNLTNLRVKTIVGQAVDPNGKGIPGVALEISQPGTTFRLDRTTAANGFTETAGQPLPFVAAADRVPPQGAWQVRAPGAGAAFPADDLRLFFIYQFTRR